MKTPILFLIFNRPDLTMKTFQEIRKIKPKQLFIAADGPRENNSTDGRKCFEAREIVKNIDWACEVRTLFRSENMGCKYAVSSAIDWFFENVEEGIILEDDCLPNQSFFDFCENMLEKYRSNAKIMHISGSNNKINIDLEESYYFSHIAYIWGWATWKRAWQHYEVNPKLNKLNLFENKTVNTYWQSLFEKIVNSNIDTWDAQWLYAIMKNNALCITPKINMIENIGFGENATHTIFAPKEIAHTEVLKGEVKHPKHINVQEDLDEFVTKKYYIQSLYKKIIWKLLKIIKT